MSDYIPYLHDEFVAETILWRLSVKSIIQCRCVCKSWYSLITNPNFISNHIICKTLTNKNPQIFLNPEDKQDKTSCLLAFDYQDYFLSVLFHLPEIPRNPFIQIVGSVNGLICFSIGKDRVELVVSFILCNPSIGRFQSIHPPSVTNWNVKGFGFDERTLDFNILLISGEIGFIYSLNSNSWRRFTCPSRENLENLCHPVLFLNGRFHWLTCDPHNCQFLRVFDLKNEAFSPIPLPECLKYESLDELHLMEFGDSSIAVRHRLEYNIWIMKEYGSVESWMELEVGVMTVLGFRNKDEVFIRCKKGGIASLKIKNNKLDPRGKILTNKYKRQSLIFSVYKYVPSLALLDKENNVDVAAPTHTIVGIPSDRYTKPDNAALTH